MLVNKNIDIIASFDTNGDIRPQRIKLDYKDQTFVYDIKEIVKIDDLKIDKSFVKDFTCKIIDNDIEKICVIRYWTDQTKFVLLKISE